MGNSGSLILGFLGGVFVGGYFTKTYGVDFIALAQTIIVTASNVVNQVITLVLK